MPAFDADQSESDRPLITVKEIFTNRFEGGTIREKAPADMIGHCDKCNHGDTVEGFICTNDRILSTSNMLCFQLLDEGAVKGGRHRIRVDLAIVVNGQAYTLLHFLCYKSSTDGKSGHYYLVAFDPSTETWMLYDDKEAYPISSDTAQLLMPDAYVVVYGSEVVYLAAHTFGLPLEVMECLF